MTAGAKDFDPLTAFISLFPEGDGSHRRPPRPRKTNLPIEEKLKKHIIDGEKRNLIEHLDEAREKYSPLEIINNILLEGMKVVGDLFGSGQMQLPFVLQSAETMKASVAHLEQFMEKIDGQSKGKIVLATVKGDVHDIGKNLVDIILTNNGYTVFNLGIKQPVADILKAWQEKKADAIGMSGLLVKSVAVMKENLEELNARGVKVPVLLGGAALTRDYAEDDLATLYKGPLLYCKDAFDGLHMMDAIAGGEVDAGRAPSSAARREAQAAARKEPEKFGDIIDGDRRRRHADRRRTIPSAAAVLGPADRRRTCPLRIMFPVHQSRCAVSAASGDSSKGALTPADLRKADRRKGPAGLRGSAAAARSTKACFEPKVVYGYFPVQSQGDDLIVYHIEEFLGCTCHPGGPGRLPADAARRASGCAFSFPAQEGRRRLCIADFFRIGRIRPVRCAGRATRHRRRQGHRGRRATPRRQQISGLSLSPRLRRRIRRGAGRVLAQADAPGAGLRQRGQADDRRSCSTRDTAAAATASATPPARIWKSAPRSSSS